MARRRFFVEQIRNHQAEIAGDEARHLTDVLRVEAGERFEISDNREVWLAEIETARKQRVVFRALERVPVSEPLVNVDVYVALIKFDRLELVIEMATELGARSITPVQTVRSERGLERAAAKRATRWRRIALEASQQSRRATLPAVPEPVTFADVLVATASHRIFLDEERNGEPLLEAVKAPQRGDSVALLAGPEGGWTDAERSAACEAGWQSVSLGPSILRTETAIVAAVAVMNAVYQAS